MIFVGLGSNRPGAWGPPAAVLKRAFAELAAFPGASVLRQSSLYETAGVGPGQPGLFMNAVVALECHCGPYALLSRLKCIERMAGPRSALRWGPRTLDLDILDYRGLTLGWDGRSKHSKHMRSGARRRLVFPHPLLHLRPFVLAPLAEIAPDWRHPILRKSASELWSSLRAQRQGRVLRRL